MLPNVCEPFNLQKLKFPKTSMLTKSISEARDEDQFGQTNFSIFLVNTFLLTNLL